MYNSSSFRRPQTTAEVSPEKYRSEVQQLKELFEAWSNEDLQSVLTETNGDVSLAAARISEGRAEQWGSVHRKKDKKSSHLPSQSQSKDLSGNRERGEFRGSRGGRGGRGGPGRGGAARGAFARGGHQETNGRYSKAGPSKPSDVVPAKAADEDVDTSAVEDQSPKPSDEAAAAVDSNASNAQTESTWNSSTPSTWGGDTAVVNGSAAPTAVPHSTPAVPKVVKTPATSKLSWAQIARAQEKPTSPLAAVAVASTLVPQTVTASVAPPPVPVALATHSQPEPAHVSEPPAPELEPEPTSQGWEEPTTVQAPTWDDEPPKPQVAEAVPAEEHKSKQEEATAQLEPSQQPVLSALPPQLQSSSVKAENVQAPAPVKPVTPAAHTRPLSAAHRHKFKSDQAVIMPSGSFGTPLEKVGMQFGSLNLGDDLDSTSHDSQPEAAPRASEPVAAETTLAPQLPPPVAPTPTQPPVVEPTPVVVSPPAQAPLIGGAPGLFQQGIPQQAQHQQVPAVPAQPAQPQTQTSLPSSLSQPAIPAQVSVQPQSSASVSNISSYSHQAPAAPPSLPSHQLPQQQGQSQGAGLSQQHQQYVQHGLPTHLDPAQAQPTAQSPQVPQVPQQTLGGHSSYFRQQDPYFHTPTPPVSASQSQEGPYGSFGQLSGQLGNQGSHLAGFGGDYGYGGESQRNFYDSYTGPTGFSNRNVLGHDEIKGLPGAPQQPHGAPGLPPSNTQPSQQLPQSSQAGNQAQPVGQGPQQGYPPPLPFYYTPYPQSQYYGSPYNSGYPQQFVKYPTVFQGPPGPQSAPSPAAKQAPGSVQPQSPYGQSLYSQQHASSPYGDMDYQHGHGQGVGSLPTNDYGKQLYGGSGQGMQGFMGLGQTNPSSAPLGQRSAGSPEAAYKPYGGNVKDVGAGVVTGVTQAGQGPQGRGVQQPQGSFYNAQRFSGAGAGPQGQAQPHQPQAQGPQGHLGYPQGNSDGAFYSYQPRQQQGYWQ